MRLKNTFYSSFCPISEVFKTLIMVAACCMSTTGLAAPLSLDQYLNQVRSGNHSYKASQLTGDAALEKAADSELVYAPTVFATVQSAVDKKELLPAAQRGTETDYMSAQFGVSKVSKFGTAGKIYYNASHTKIHGTSNMYVPEPEWHETAPTLEVTQPLWKNALGRDLEKTVELQAGQANITKLTEQLKRKVSMSEAEGNYWRLVLARESLRVSKENLERVKKIVAWNRRRVSKELADSADLIQAEALGEIREMEVTIAIDEERAASYAFNTSRGDPNPSVKEELIKITGELLANLPLPARAAEREDLTVSIQAARLSDIGADLAESKYQPSLDIFASGSLNGRNTTSYAKANSESQKAKHATYALGVKLSAPIGGESINRLRAGYAHDRQAAALSLQRKRYENDREWTDLTLKLQEGKSRLNLTQKIESTQLRKLNAERDRQSRGRSTMFQVMQCETDYAASQLNVIRNKAEILGIIARMKTFGGEG